jgi:hypothetical protein
LGCKPESLISRLDTTQTATSFPALHLCSLKHAFEMPAISERHRDPGRKSSTEKRKLLLAQALCRCSSPFLPSFVPPDNRSPVQLIDESSSAGKPKFLLERKIS